MGLADILDAVRREGDEEVARVVAARDEAVAAVWRAARDEAQAVEAAAAASRDAALATEAGVVRHRAELHVERRLQEAREAVFQDILGRARDRLSRHRLDPGYTATLDALLTECTAFLGDLAVVMADPRDVELVRAALARIGSDATVESSLECWGGIVAGDGNGVFVRNTLEDRLQRAEAELRRRLGGQVPGLRCAGVGSS